MYVYMCVCLWLMWFFVLGYCDHRDLHVLTHSFPTRRSSDLPVGSLLLLSPANKDFELSQGRQVEVGVKQTFWGDKGEWTLAAYHIRKKDLVTRDPNDPSLREQVGSQSSRGLELTVGVELARNWRVDRSEEHTSELQSLMRISYAVFCLKKKNDT